MMEYSFFLLGLLRALPVRTLMKHISLISPFPFLQFFFFSPFNTCRIIILFKGNSLTLISYILAKSFHYCHLNLGDFLKILQLSASQVAWW